MLLTDKEIKEIHFNLCNTVGSDYKTVARAIEAAILAKLASAELPEPIVIDRHESGIVIRGYTADQLRQAYAQGAAAQLSSEPACWVTPDGLGVRMRLSPPVDAMRLGWQEFYTRREA